MERQYYAAELFLEGYNCTQAVCIAFCDVTGLTKRQAAKWVLLSAAAWAGCGRSAARSAACTWC